MSTITAGKSTWVNRARSSTSYGQTSTLKVKANVSSDEQQAFIRFQLPATLQPGVTVDTATLQIPMSGTTGSGTLTVQRADAIVNTSMTWGTKPGVTGGTATASAAAVLSFNVKTMLQAWVDGGGGTHPGWRITSSDTTSRTLLGIGSASLVLEYSTTPAKPTNVHPEGLVTTSKPDISFNAGTHTAIQVQIAPTGTTFDSTAGYTSPTFDSGTVASTSNGYPLSTSSYGGLSSGSTTTTVRVQNGSKWSPWSDPVTMTRTTPPTPSITDPSTTTVYDSQTPLTITCTNLTSVRWTVTPSTSTIPTYDSGTLAATSPFTHTPTKPAFLTQGASYVITAQATVSTAYEDAKYLPVSKTVTLDYAVISGPTTLTVTQPDASPKVHIALTNTGTAPEQYAVTVNGGSDAYYVPGDFPIDLWNVPPNTASTIRVAPRQDGVNRAAGLTQTITTQVGVDWLVDPVTSEAAWILTQGDVDQPFASVESSVLHTPENSEYVVRRRLGRRKPEGSVAGFLKDSFLGNASTAIALFQKWGDPNQTPADKVFHYFTGDVIVPVWIGDVDVRPSLHTKPGDIVKAVSFSWWSAPEPTSA